MSPGTKYLGFRYSQAYEATAYHENLTVAEGDPMKIIAVSLQFAVFGLHVIWQRDMTKRDPEAKVPKIPPEAITGMIPIDDELDALRAMSDPLPVIAKYVDRYRGSGLETFPAFLE